MERKPIQICTNLHYKLKTQALKEKITIGELIMKMFIKYMSTLCVLFLFVSCSSTTYTKIDEPNYKRYNHDQKIELGMTVEEVMDLFGTPSKIEKTWGNKMMVIEFRYYRAIHCQEMMCFVQFDEESRKVVNYINFRGEYINFMKK